jgi:hypothetical protein
MNVATMLALAEAIVGAFFAAFRLRASLVVENLVLRQQLAILRRAMPRSWPRKLGRLMPREATISCCREARSR